MEANIYEKTYESVVEALRATNEVNKVVEFLREATKPVSCKEIGEAIYGEEYKRIRAEYENKLWSEMTKEDWENSRHNVRARELTGKLTQVLRHLVSAKFVEMEEIKGEAYPLEVVQYGKKVTIMKQERIRVYRWVRV